MVNCRQISGKFWKCLRAATGVEYGMALALIAIVTLGAVEVTGNSVSDIFSTADDNIGVVQTIAAEAGGAVAGPGGENPGGELDPEQQGDDETAFLAFFDETAAQLSAVYQSNIVVVPAWADGKNAVLTGDPSAILLLNFVPAGTTAMVTENDILGIEMTSSASAVTAVAATLTIGSDSSTWTITTAGDLDPDQFSFTDVASVDLSAVVESDTVTLAGFDGNLDLSAASSLGDAVELVIDGVETGSATASVVAGSTVAVRASASGEFETSKLITVTLGGYSSVWSITTKGAGAEPGSAIFAYTGSVQTFTVPNGVTELTVKAWGAGGGGGGTNGSVKGGVGGGGAFVSGVVSVTSGSDLSIYVGQGGGSGASAANNAFGGGGRRSSGTDPVTSTGSGGGGATYILDGGSLLMAAGAGGGAGGGYTTVGGDGGYGGLTTGGNGGAGYTITRIGYGGSQSSGGSGFVAGSMLQGGDTSAPYSGGGGGSGYYGGGGSTYYSGAGGGSSYLPGGFGGTPSAAGSGRSPGGATDVDYPGGDVGYGGLLNANGGSGYVIVSW